MVIFKKTEIRKNTDTRLYSSYLKRFWNTVVLHLTDYTVGIYSQQQFI